MVLLRKMLELDRDAVASDIVRRIQICLLIQTAATLDIARRSQLRFLILGAPRVHMARRRFLQLGL